MPIHNHIVDESFDFSISEQQMIVTPQTSMWEIQHKLCEFSEDENERDQIGASILEALRRVGIYPQ